MCCCKSLNSSCTPLANKVATLNTTKAAVLCCRIHPLLDPHNLLLLLQVLSYHVIPSGAVLSSQLRDCLQVPTALPDAAAANLTVRVRNGNIDFEGATNDARVMTADIRAGASVIHVMDDVLLPAGIGRRAEPPSFPDLSAALEGANLAILAAAVEVWLTC
jgi:hypothetical protein